MRNKKKMTILFLFLLGIVLNTLFTMNQLIDDFSYTSASLAKICEYKGHIIIEPYNGYTGFFLDNINKHSFRPISYVFLCIFSIIISIDSSVLISTPITGFLISLTLLIIFKKYINKYRNISFLLIAVLLGVNIRNAVVLGSTFYYISIGIFMFLLFSFILIKKLKSITIKEIAILVMIGLLLPFVYYTSAFLAIIFTIVYFSSIKLFSNSEVNNLRRKYIWIIVLIVIISFLNEGTPYKIVKDEILYGSPLVSFSYKTTLNWLKEILFTKSGYYMYKPIFIRHSILADFLGKTSLFMFIIMFFVVLIKIIKKLRGRHLDESELILFSFFIVSLLHSLIYMMFSNLSLMFLWIFIPLIFLFYGKKKVMFYFLLLTFITTFALQLLFATDNSYENYFKDSEAITEYLAGNLHPTTRTKIFISHHMDALLTFKLIQSQNINQTLNLKHYIIAPYSEELMHEALVKRIEDIFYVQDNLIGKFKRIGVFGFQKDYFIDILEKENIIYNLLYSNDLNNLLFIRKSYVND